MSTLVDWALAQTIQSTHVPKGAPASRLSLSLLLLAIQELWK